MLFCKCTVLFINFNCHLHDSQFSVSYKWVQSMYTPSCNVTVLMPSKEFQVVGFSLLNNHKAVIIQIYSASAWNLGRMDFWKKKKECLLLSKYLKIYISSVRIPSLKTNSFVTHFKNTILQEVGQTVCLSFPGQRLRPLLLCLHRFLAYVQQNMK